MASEPVINMMNQYIKEEQVMMQKIAFQAQDFLGPDEMKDQLFLELKAASLWDKMEARLTLYIRGVETQNEKAEVVFRYPKNWWEWFKKAKFPEWLLKKYPVQYEKKSKWITFTVGEYSSKLSKYFRIPRDERFMFSELTYDDYENTIDMEKE